ncbi:major capsid protein [Ralstonia solanacearum]|uniref:Minor capsid protein E n=1 Tax=Ralstonia solanacearum K60 TaxID=1091042 RepID=A0AAP7ZMY0_RALSL|nr:major capsid protein [Ralstonia solanacearum]MBT1536442.1 major capsid protein [Ralstonia solanacearum]OYQ13570.1 minor capsid protein E [Ralstonia solanacearum K60]CCF97558.1 putative bacteriophage-related protein [Ralstonia solanacearum K60]
MQNPFSNPAFSMASMTAAINLIPNRYGKLEAMNLFAPKPVRTRQIIVEQREGVLTLLPTLPPGSPGTVGTRGRRNVRSFVIPHIPHDDVVLPESVQGLRAFGSDTELESVSAVMAERLETMRNKHAITLEHLRMGALKGEILDADGSTLYNLFEEFRIQQKVVSFELGADKTEVRNKCTDVLGMIEDALLGEVTTGAHCLCSTDFFKALVSQKTVKEAYSRWREGVMLINDVRNGFEFGGITFEEYRGKASDAEGKVRNFIEPGEAHIFPTGTIDTFSTYFAPADFNETVNTLGQPMYAKQEPRKFDRGTDVHTQANPLPMCLRPGVLVKLTMG